MKYFVHLFLACTMATSCQANNEKKPQDEAQKEKPAKSKQGFAVVELFTSEGCSSCPPADAALAALSEKYKEQNVLFLEEHVTYWDRLGWKDPFAKPIFTERQYAYNNQMERQGVYTPQAVVNGSVEMVGSRKSELSAAVENSLANSNNKAIEMTSKVEGKKIVVQYQTNLIASERVIVLLVQKQATIAVGRGENGGKSLTHHNIVLEIKESSKAEDAIRFRQPKNLEPSNWFIAVFTKDSSGKVTGLATF